MDTYKDTRTFPKRLLERSNNFEEVVERYLDCGNPRSGLARVLCPDCHSEHLLTFSCKTRGFCASYHAKRREEWGQ